MIKIDKIDKITEGKFMEQKIIRQLESLKEKYINPVRIFIGRNYSNAIKSCCDYDNHPDNDYDYIYINKTKPFYDSDAPSQVKTKRVLYFNNDIMDENFIIHLKSFLKIKKINVIMVQFDWSTMKFMNELPSLLNNISDILVSNGVLIAESSYHVYHDNVRLSHVRDINHIVLDIKLPRESHDKIIQNHKKIVDFNLRKIFEKNFSSVVFKEKCFVPFFIDLIDDYYVCFK